MIEVWPDAARFPSPGFLGYGSAELGADEDVEIGALPIRYDYGVERPTYKGLPHSLRFEGTEQNKNLLGPIQLGDGNWNVGEQRWFGAVIAVNRFSLSGFPRSVLQIRHRGYSRVNPYTAGPVHLGIRDGHWFLSITHNPLTSVNAQATVTTSYQLGPVLWSDYESFLCRMVVSPDENVGQVDLFRGTELVVAHNGANFFVGENLPLDPNEYTRTGLFQLLGLARELGDDDQDQVIAVGSLVYADSNHTFDQVYRALAWL